MSLPRADFSERLGMARSVGVLTVDYPEEDVSVLTALNDPARELDRIHASTPWDSKHIPRSFKECDQGQPDLKDEPVEWLSVDQLHGQEVDAVALFHRKIVTTLG